MANKQRESKAGSMYSRQQNNEYGRTIEGSQRIDIITQCSMWGVLCARRRAITHWPSMQLFY